MFENLRPGAVEGLGQSLCSTWVHYTCRHGQTWCSLPVDLGALPVDKARHWCTLPVDMSRHGCSVPIDMARQGCTVFVDMKRHGALYLYSAQHTRCQNSVHTCGLSIQPRLCLLTCTVIEWDSHQPCMCLMTCTVIEWDSHSIGDGTCSTCIFIHLCIDTERSWTCLRKA